MLPARIALVAVSALLAAGAHAQQAPAPASAAGDPADARAATPPVVHRSPFADYRRFSADGPGPWKAVNDEVARIGGWKAYAREVYEANEAAKRAAPAPAAAPRER